MNMIESAKELRSQGKTWMEVTDALREMGFTEATSEDSVRGKVRRHENKKGSITFTDKKPLPTDDDVASVIDSFILAQYSLDALDTEQNNCHITLDDTLPVGIAFTGDWHTGSKWADYSKMRSDFGLIARTPGLYVGFQGDAKDNFLRQGTPPGQHDQLFTPGLQDKVTLHFFNMLREKLLWVVEGNHDAWTDTVADIPIMEYVANQTGSVYLGPGGMVNLKLGAVTYEIATRHHFAGSTKLNPGGGNRKLFWEVLGCDISALAHLHYMLSEQERLGIGDKARDVVLIRNGAYKLRDKHSRRNGFAEGESRVPMVVLYPDSKQMVPFKSLYEGIRFLESERGGR